jgi:hypothetical protein
MSDVEAKAHDAAPAHTPSEPKAAGDAHPSQNSSVAPTAQVNQVNQEATATSAANPPPSETTPIAQLWSLAQAAGHPEIWGVTLADPENHIPTRIILQKYLNANDGDLAKAKDQLSKTLEWRAKIKPLDLVKKVYSKTKFEALGYVTTYVEEGSSEPEGKEVFTWNIYGGVKSIDETFGKLEE